MQIGFLGLLGLIFITLKLTGYIMWSWWLVLLPLYVGIALSLSVFLLATIIAIIAAGTGRRGR